MEREDKERLVEDITDELNTLMEEAEECQLEINRLQTRMSQLGYEIRRLQRTREALVQD